MLHLLAFTPLGCSCFEPCQSNLIKSQHLHRLDEADYSVKLLIKNIERMFLNFKFKIFKGILT